MDEYQKQIIDRRSIAKESHDAFDLNTDQKQNTSDLDNKSSKGHRQQLRLQNSMQFECILHFSQIEKCQEWKKLIQISAQEIDRTLGKSTQLSSDELRESERSPDVNNAIDKEPLESHNHLQVLQIHDIQFNKIEIILEGQSKIELNGSLINKNVKDCIVLSAK